MYLKRQRFKDGYHFMLSESYYDEDCWKHRELMDLGPDPEDHIVYPGGNGFYISEEVEERLEARGATYGAEELEDLFLPFLAPDIRRIVETFSNRSRRPSPWNGHPSDEMLKRQRALHAFDKRRLHYLRCGRVDIGDLDARHLKFFNVLMDKSRDEIEAYIEEMERVLMPGEYRRYLYAALQLETHFRHLLTRHHPEAVDMERMEGAFVRDLCRLNQDERFFTGVELHDPGTLHPYLVKYLIWFFDEAPEWASAPGEDRENFIHWKFSRRSSQGLRLSARERDACRQLGFPPEDFSKIGRTELTRRYRRKAKAAHPDKGGDSRAFVEVVEAYERLLRRKR